MDNCGFLQPRTQPTYLIVFFLGFLATLSNCHKLPRMEPATPATGGFDYQYPYPLQFYTFTSQQQNLTMGYMDIPPASNTTPQGTIVLLHGKNFCGVTWYNSTQVLTTAGYRVVIPDQIGFCKSTKPGAYQFSISQLATNTNGLLNSLGIANATVMGHSMGGMIAARYALTFPEQTYQLVMVDPLGLEDWVAKGVPYQTIDVTFQTELATTFNSIKAYQNTTYYVGKWQPEYDVWVEMLMRIYSGPEARPFAFDMALVTDAILTQPIIYQLPQLKMQSLLIVGDKDNTAIGKAWAPDSVKPLLGHYDVLGKEVAAEVPNCTLIAFPELGHAPQISDANAFNNELLGWLLK